MCGIGLPTASPVLVRLQTNALDQLLASRSRERARCAFEYQPTGHRVGFLSREHAFGEAIDWRCRQVPDVTRLWQFQLHSHEFLADLLVDGDDADERSNVFWREVCDWIENNRPDASEIFDEAWHPYCISRRLPIWMMAWAAYPPAAAIANVISESILRQLSFLDRNLEWDLRGNHLLENLAALALGSVFFAGPAADRWGMRAARLLKQQLDDQVLEHGEHFERSPMYHARMLQVILDVRDAARETRPELSDACAGAATRMADWLEAVLHPDGNIPLLSDSAFDQTPQCVPLIQRARRDDKDYGKYETDVRSDGCPDVPGGELHGSVWTWRDGADFLLFDAGPVGADELPAHAHNDPLTFEASLGGQRMIVDSGTYDYGEGAMRAYCRSTRAHNTLQVDEAEPCDVWSRFRMGYRGWPTTPQFGTTGEFAWCRATHDAYRRQGVPELGRWLACRPGGPWIGVEWARGSGEHRLTQWLHWHPDVRVEKVAEGEISVLVGSRTCRLRYETPGQLSVERGYYCPEFGVRIEAPVVKWTSMAVLPGYLVWWLEWSDTRGDVRVGEGNDGEIEIEWQRGDQGGGLDGAQQVRLRPMGGE